MRLVRTLGLLLFAAIAGVSEAAAQLVSITIAPPVLPVYVQPALPGPGYIWTPGYWAYGDDGYYWVPGTWVLPPAVGVLWTPGYWGWHDGIYAWNAGYWVRTSASTAASIMDLAIPALAMPAAFGAAACSATTERSTISAASTSQTSITRR